MALDISFIRAGPAPAAGTRPPPETPQARGARPPKTTKTKKTDIDPPKISVKELLSRAIIPMFQGGCGKLVIGESMQEGRGKSTRVAPAAPEEHGEQAELRHP